MRKSEETRKHLHELIDKLSDEQASRVYWLIMGILGKVI